MGISCALQCIDSNPEIFNAAESGICKVVKRNNDYRLIEE
jgi:hypothetical protein